MAKRGPAPRDPADLRQHRYCVYLTDAERADLLARVVPGDPGDPGELSEQSIRRYVGRHLRESALARQPASVPAINREAWADLSRLAGNLNQYQRAVNEGQAPPPGVDLAELRGAVDRLRNELLGVRDEGED